MMIANLPKEESLAILNDLYKRLNRPEYVSPDPLELVLKSKTEDMEIVGLIAASLAVGKASLIVAAVEEILKLATNGENFNYAKSLNDKSLADLEELFAGFKYRFYSGKDIALFLYGIKQIVGEYGSIEDFAKTSLNKQRCAINLGRDFYNFFIRIFQEHGGETHGLKHLIPDPEKGSSLKRLNLYFRWMCRQDDVDPGVWGLESDFLVIPLDVHMLKLNTLMGITKSKQANMKTALEITNYYSSLNKKDPVKWDFSLTRLGIHPDFTYQDLKKNKNNFKEAI